MPLLRRLKRIALKENDHGLLGFAYYGIAEAYYSLELDYANFRKNLQKAIENLHRSNETDLLARAYNFIGIDAMNNGCFDIAYHYYMTSLRVASTVDDSVVTGIASSNVAQVFLLLDDLKKAKYYSRQSIINEEGHTEDVYYYRNIVVGYYHYALINLLMGNIKTSEKYNKKIDECYAASEYAGMDGVDIPVQCLRVMLALVKRDEKKVQELMAESEKTYSKKVQLFDYMEDIKIYCKYLLQYKHYDEVKKLIDLIDEDIKATDVNYMIRAIADIKIAYYEATGNNELTLQYLQEQHAIAEKQSTEQNELYLESISLIDLMEQLHLEQQAVQKENETLQVKANTDALTGIPNRYALNQVFEEAYERASSQKTPLGVEILDIDFFKEYNDTYGHPAGDACLEIISKTLLEMAKQDGIFCARYGGDEFVILYENKTDKMIHTLAEELERQIDSYQIEHKTNPLSKYVTIAQGICNSVPGKKASLWEYLSIADDALYTVKKAHRQGKRHASISMHHLKETKS